MRWILVLAALGGLAHPLGAQVTPTVTLGSRVRVRTLTAGGALDPPIEGTVERLSRDTLTLRPRTGGPPQIITPLFGDELSLFTGRRSSLARGTIIGGMLGFVAGGIRGAVSGKACPESEAPCAKRPQLAFTGGLILGATGAAVGLIIGAFTSHEIWTPARVFSSTRPDVSLGIHDWGWGLSVAF